MLFPNLASPRIAACIPTAAGSTNAASIVVIPSGTWYVHSSGCVMYSQRAPL